MNISATEYTSTQLSVSPGSYLNSEGAFAVDTGQTTLVGLYFSNLTDPNQVDGLRLFSFENGQLAELSGTNIPAVQVGFQKGPAVLADLNGDGFLDIFNVDHGKEVPGTQVNGAWPGGTNHLLLGSATGFSPASVSGLTDNQRFWHDVSGADYDNDGDIDLAITSFDAVYIYENDGKAGFSSQKIADLTNHGALEFINVDGDPSLELVTAPYLNWGDQHLATYDPDQNWTAMTASGTSPFASLGAFELATVVSAHTGQTSLVAAVEGGIGIQKLLIAPTNSDGSFGDFVEIQTDAAGQIRDVIVMDLNDDGNDDIFLNTNVNIDFADRVLLNAGNNTFYSPGFLQNLASSNELVIPLNDPANGSDTEFLAVSPGLDNLNHRVISVDFTATGTNGNDNLTGDSGNDVLIGRAGSDTVYAGAGNDAVWAGSGDNGADQLFGGLGNDTLGGGGGNDRLEGEAGNDLLFGGSGNDIGRGGDGADTAWMGEGQDTVWGDGGADTFGGGAGNDVLNGGGGNDVAYGASGNDDVAGSSGADELFGGAGNDTLTGGGGNDSLFGGSGDDLFIFEADHGDDFIGGFATKGSNTIDISALNLSGFNALSISQTGGDARIETGSGTITLWNTDASGISADDFIF